MLYYLSRIEYAYCESVVTEVIGSLLCEIVLRVHLEQYV